MKIGANWMIKDRTLPPPSLDIDPETEMDTELRSKFEFLEVIQDAGLKSFYLEKMALYHEKKLEEIGGSIFRKFMELRFTSYENCKEPSRQHSEQSTRVSRFKKIVSLYKDSYTHHLSRSLNYQRKSDLEHFVAKQQRQMEPLWEKIDYRPDMNEPEILALSDMVFAASERQKNSLEEKRCELKHEEESKMVEKAIEHEKVIEYYTDILEALDRHNDFVWHRP
uniref:Uncharacterized protein n=1 Tax=Caenorhabditis japonica TaxID=281687 RepID=A0A8R1J0C9_CAEJA